MYLTIPDNDEFTAAQNVSMPHLTCKEHITETTLSKLGPVLFLGVGKVG